MDLEALKHPNSQNKKESIESKFSFGSEREELVSPRVENEFIKAGNEVIKNGLT